MEKTLEELKQEAKDLGITFVPNISAAKLAAKIEAFYESQETSDKEILEAAVEAKEKSEKVTASHPNFCKSSNTVIMRARRSPRPCAGPWSGSGSSRSRR